MKIDIDSLKANAKKLAPAHKQMFKKLTKQQLKRLDEDIHDLHDDVFDEIDCLACANCCRSLGPRLTDKDIEKMASATRSKPSEVVEQYLRIDEDGDYVFRSMPCPFLMEDNYCMIYENRPKACREYPHTDRKRFYQIHSLTVKNAETCPAVFELLERFRKLSMKSK